METTIQTFINQAVEQDLLGARKTFDDLIGSRVMDAIAAKKIEVAQTMFNQSSSDEQDKEE